VDKRLSLRKMGALQQRSAAVCGLSISRILSDRLRDEAAISLMRPTHSVFSTEVKKLNGQLFSVCTETEPTWPCTRRGFSCGAFRRHPFRDRRHYCRRGGLLHHHFTFFPSTPFGVIRMYLFCDTFRSSGILPGRPPFNTGRLALWCSDFPPRSA